MWRLPVLLNSTDFIFISFGINEPILIFLKSSTTKAGSRGAGGGGGGDGAGGGGVYSLTT